MSKFARAIQEGIIRRREERRGEWTFRDHVQLPKHFRAKQKLKHIIEIAH